MVHKNICCLQMFRQYLQSLSIPDVLIEILYLVGFDNPIAMKKITTDNIEEIENYVSKNLKDSLTSSVYAGMKKFVFLPGHKAILLSLAPYIEKYEQEMEIDDRSVEKLPLSFIMKKMIRTAMNNKDKDQNHRRFPSEIRHFAIYIYTMCGKACYEVLCNNLPLPQANTVCKFENYGLLIRLMSYRFS